MNYYQLFYYQLFETSEKVVRASQTREDSG